MVLQIISISVFLFGAVIGWLVVYFVRKYKDYNPKVLRDTSKQSFKTVLCTKI